MRVLLSVSSKPKKHNLQRILPVSYTHLDVDKRQVTGSTQDGIRGIGDETKWIEKQRKQIIRDVSDIQRGQRCTQ